MTVPSQFTSPTPDLFPGPSEPTLPVSLKGMTLADGRDELAGRGFDYLSPGRMTIMLNDAKNDFEDTWEFPWLQRWISGVAPLQVLDLKYVRTVKLHNSHCGPYGTGELLELDIRQIAQGATDLAQSGPPEYWYAEGGLDDVYTLGVWPVADATLDVAYIAQSPELAEPSDRPWIPPRYRSIWVDLAVIRAYRDSDNFTAANQLAGDVEARLQELILRYETFNRQHSSFMSVRSFSEDE